MLSQDFKEFVKLLIDHKVEYLIVGGYAVSIHGHPRYTGYLDIWIHPTLENSNSLVKCVNDFVFGSFKLTSQDFIKEENVIQFGYPPLRIDILTSIDGVNFGDCILNKKDVEIDGMFVHFIGLADLLKNKKESARPRDLDDIENLK